MFTRTPIREKIYMAGNNYLLNCFGCSVRPYKGASKITTFQIWMKWIQENGKITRDSENRQLFWRVLLKRKQSNGGWSMKSDIGSMCCSCCYCLLLKMREIYATLYTLISKIENRKKNGCLQSKVDVRSWGLWLC